MVKHRMGSSSVTNFVSIFSKGIVEFGKAIDYQLLFGVTDGFPFFYTNRKYKFSADSISATSGFRFRKARRKPGFLYFCNSFSRSLPSRIILFNSDRRSYIIRPAVLLWIIQLCRRFFLPKFSIGYLVKKIVLFRMVAKL